MARTSKRYIQEEIKSEEKSKFKAGVYTRLSNERSEEWRSKSFSIETQTLACKEYALKESIDVVEVYTDYEYSGTNFERPAFIKMMEDIKTRRINCILVRDLSRLGREYLEMGRLIDKVFPFLGVRFISVSDKVDTFNELDSKKSFEVTLKNIINDMYAKDISVKVKTSKHNRAKKGYFIGSVPPYGYKVEKLKEGQKLVIDESTSPIVRLMFDLALEGYSQYEIAKKFNEIGYTTAKTYYNTGRIYREDGDPEWHKGSISKMLVKPVYTGKLVQGVKQQNLAKGEKQAWADESEHIIVENAVPAIITTEEHENIISERKKRKDLHYFSCKPHDFDREPENRYKGKIFSKFSGKELVRRIVIYGKNKDKFHYVFRNERCTGKLNEEPNIHILERDIDEELEKIVGAMIKQGTSEEKLKAKIKKRYEIIFNDAEKTIKALNKAIAKEELVMKQSYEKYKDGKLDIEKYRLKREIAQNHIQINNDELVEIEDKANMLRTEEKKALEWIQHLYKAEGIQKLSKELIDMLVEKIVVMDREHFDIEFRFAPIELKGACKDE